MNFQIGIDGGGSKTEFILVAPGGAIVARHLAPGCNPSSTDQDTVRSLLAAGLRGMVAAAPAPVSATLLCMAGSRVFWRAYAAALPAECGRGLAVDDSLPVLELATGGAPGLVLHAGTGSFVAARGPDGATHYAGGLGWRFGDAGSGHDLGRRAVARALLELQGWETETPLATLLRDHTAQPDAAGASRFFYAEANAATAKVAALAPAVLRLATEGDPTARQLVLDSAGELHALALKVAAKIFPSTPLATLRCGLSGPLLTNPLVRDALAARSPLPLAPVEGSPIEGVRRMLARGCV